MKNYFPIILIGIIIFFTLLIRGGWIEPDTYAFISRACGTSEFESPQLSQILFNALGCDRIKWFIAQAALWIITLLAMAWFLKKKGYETENIFYLGLSLNVIYALLAFEDDFLVTALLFIATLSITTAYTNRKLFYLAEIILLIGLFVWKGAFLIGSIILLGAINPLLGILPTMAYIVYNGFDSWQGAIEGSVFNGFTTLIPIVIILFFSSKERIIEFYSKNKKLSIIFASLLLLGFYQAKWGLYSALFFPIVFHEILKKENHEKIRTIGLIVLLSSVPLIGLTKPPLENHWKVLEKALEVEKKGNSIYIDQGFGLERWGYEYLGGKPTYATKPNNPYYYLGVKPGKCQPIAQADNLTLAYCQ